VTQASQAEAVIGSEAAMRRARRVLARGVASSARLRAAGFSPVMRRAEGARLEDIDGNDYVDFVLGLGPAILGHSPPAVIEAVRESLTRAVLYGAPQEAEAELCERVVAAVPSAEMVVYASSGSEGVQLAVRIARAGTGRQRIVKFEGHYHGWIDPLFVNSPPLAPVESVPAAPTHSVEGLSASADQVTVARWGSLAELERALAAGPPAAAVVMEPVPCNFGSFEPEPGYLDGVSQLCREHGALVLYDEVLTGFRLALGGAQERFGAMPDLTVCSKAIASGFPLAVVAGSRAAMAPAVDGPVRAAGTFNATPSSVAAGNATLAVLAAEGERIYPRLDRLGAQLAAAIEAVAAERSAPLSVNRVGSVLQLFWGVDGPVSTYPQACASDRGRVATLSAHLLGQGVHVSERGLLLLCDAHGEADLERTRAAFGASLAAMKLERQDSTDRKGNQP